MKKLPWGIIAGICGIVVFFTIVGTIAAYIILGAIANQTSDTATIFDTWYQTLLFIADILFGLGFLGSVGMYAYKMIDAKSKAKEEVV